MRYRFADNPRKPGYFNVYDPAENLVAEFWHEHALVVVLMYENMFRQNERRANEFMYGHILGMSQAILYADKYPKVEVSRGPHGVTTLKVIDPVLGPTYEGPPNAAPGATDAAGTILRKSFGKKEDEH